MFTQFFDKITLFAKIVYSTNDNPGSKNKNYGRVKQEKIFCSVFESPSWLHQYILQKL